jgi:hypothetical protein
MKLIIAGGRDIGEDVRGRDWSKDRARLWAIYRAHHAEHGMPTEFVSGAAPGVDRFGEDVAKGFDMVPKRFPADWDKYPKAAGPIRNRQMAQYADALLLIWDGKSRGSANMKAEMLKLGKPVYEHVVEG